MSKQVILFIFIFDTTSYCEVRLVLGIRSHMLLSNMIELLKEKIMSLHEIISDIIKKFQFLNEESAAEIYRMELKYLPHVQL